MKYIDWNKLSELGLVEKINREVLHPLGLAVMRSPESGHSIGALISDDGKWEYDPALKSGVLPDNEVRERLKSIEPDGNIG